MSDTNHEDAETVAAIFAGHEQAVLWPILDRFDEDFQYRHCDVGPGWFPLLHALHVDLVVTDPGYRVAQVKSKFGGLRFYTSALSEAGRRRVAQAETESGRTCEDCGQPGETRGVGWKTTLCDACASKPPVTDP